MTEIQSFEVQKRPKMIHPLGKLHKQISVGDICKIDLNRVHANRTYNSDKYKFLAFRHCVSISSLTDSCKKCKGKMVFLNLRTNKKSCNCYGYRYNTPVVLLVQKQYSLPDDLFEI